MNIRQVFDVYSNRHKAPRKGTKSLTPRFRNRVLVLCNDTHSSPFDFLDSLNKAGFWSDMRKKLLYLHGLRNLSGGEASSAEEDVVRFLSNCSDEHFLDFVELIFKSRTRPKSHENAARLISSVNEFFDVDGLPYRLIDPGVSSVREVAVATMRNSSDDSELNVNAATQKAFPHVICRENEVIYDFAIEPTLTLLTEPFFCQANEEFLEALEDYRKGDYRDCVAKCGSSLESVMKVICKRKGWTFSGDGEAAKLFKTILSQTNLEPFYDKLLQLVPIIRNQKSSAHGGGSQPRVVHKHIANFVINSTASAILLLVDETNP